VEVRHGLLEIQVRMTPRWTRKAAACRDFKIDNVYTCGSDDACSHVPALSKFQFAFCALSEPHVHCRSWNRNRQLRFYKARPSSCPSWGRAYVPGSPINHTELPRFALILESVLSKFLMGNKKVSSDYPIRRLHADRIQN
jgi:hypothetical protein